MAENNPELDAIKHLIEVEKTASSLINDAKTEADKRLSEAHLKYNSQYKEKYDQLVAHLDDEFKKSHDQIEAKYKKELDDYKASIEAKSQDKKSFESLLEKLLLA